MHKRGQFYLITAVVLIIIIGSFVGYSNYAESRTPLRVYDLGKELDIESQHVLEYGIINNEREIISQDNTASVDLLEHFTTLYYQYAESSAEDLEMYFILGDGESYTLYEFQETTTGTISLSLEGENTGVSFSRIAVVANEDIAYSEEEGVLRVTVGTGRDATTHEFTLQTGESFYYVITQEYDGEQYTTTN